MYRRGQEFLYIVSENSFEHAYEKCKQNRLSMFLSVGLSYSSALDASLHVMQAGIVCTVTNEMERKRGRNVKHG